MPTTRRRRRDGVAFLAPEQIRTSEQLADRLLALALTQADIAQRLGWSRGKVTRWLGRRVNLGVEDQATVRTVFAEHLGGAA